MKDYLFSGVGTALITPMNSDGSINYDKYAEIIDEQIAGGVDALFPCGTTGESATMSIQEHMDVVKFAIEHVNHRVPVIAGAGSNDTAVAISAAQECEKYGADGLLVVTPYYNKTSQRGLIAHYTAIANSVKLPIWVYNVPSRTGCCVKPETLAELAKLPNIVAVKEASGNISAVAKIRQLCGDNLAVFSGNDDQVTAIMSLGGKGVISVFSHIFPEKMRDITHAALDGDFKKSSEIQLEYLDLINALFVDVNPIPVKEAMNMLGKNVGPCRLPLYEMTDADKAVLRKALCNHGLLK